jgi:hypothetical protein
MGARLKACGSRIRSSETAGEFSLFEAQTCTSSTKLLASGAGSSSLIVHPVATSLSSGEMSAEFGLLGRG